MTQFAPEPGQFEATWQSSGDSPCDWCAEQDGRVFTNPFDIDLPGDNCFGEIMRGGGHPCTCTLSISDDRFRSGRDEEVDATAFDPEDWTVSDEGKSARITKSWSTEELQAAHDYLRKQLDAWGYIFTTDDAGYDLDKSAYAPNFNFKTGQVEKPESQKMVEWLFDDLLKKGMTVDELVSKLAADEPSVRGHTHVRTYGDKHFPTMCFLDDVDSSVAGVNR